MKQVTAIHVRLDGTFVEPERCDDCGAIVGYYDSALPEGEKIIITRPCRCWEGERNA